MEEVGLNSKRKTKESEWSLKRIFTRLLMYPFCFGVIGVGIWMIIEPIWARSIFAGIGLIIFGAVYIYADITIMIRKNRNNRP